MKLYILQRLIWFIPGLFIVSLLAFAISVNTPGDPIDVMLASEPEKESDDPTIENNLRNQWRSRLGLDLPLFYFSLTSLSTPNATLSSTLTKEEEAAMKKLAFTSGNAANSRLLHMSFDAMWDVLAADTGRIQEKTREQALVRINSLKTADSKEKIEGLMGEIRKLNILDPQFNRKFIESDKLFRKWRIEKSAWRSWVPSLRFHPDNRYHRWLWGDPFGYSKGVMRGDFGISLHTKQPISKTILSGFKWSAFLAITSVLIAFLISIPLGVWAGARPGSWFDTIVQFKLFLLYCIPSFWMGTLLLVLFANPDVLPLFPASGISPAGGLSQGMSFLEKCIATIPYLALPLICYTYASLAFTTRIIRSAVRENMMQDHILTAKAKGLPLPKIAFKHAFRNALLPAITVFTEVFPMAIGGSVIIETIFTIPGLGYETVNAVFTRDYPMIVAVCALTVVFTMTGNLLADLLYGLADPRVKLKGQTNG